MGYHINNIGLGWSHLDGGRSGGCGSVAIGRGNTGVVAIQGLLPRITDKWCFVIVADIDCEIVRMVYFWRVKYLRPRRAGSISL